MPVGTMTVPAPVDPGTMVAANVPVGTMMVLVL